MNGSKPILAYHGVDHARRFRVTSTGKSQRRLLYWGAMVPMLLICAVFTIGEMKAARAKEAAKHRETAEYVERQRAEVLRKRAAGQPFRERSAGVTRR